MGWDRGSGETVLIAEDTSALREVLAQLVTDLGYRVLAAGTGEEAIRMAAGERVDLLLTDIRMPGISGPEVARRVGAARVIYMSGYLPEDCDIPAQELLEKPFSPGVLARRLRQSLDQPAG